MWDKAKPFVIAAAVVIVMQKLGYIAAGPNKLPLVG